MLSLLPTTCLVRYALQTVTSSTLSHQYIIRTLHVLDHILVSECQLKQDKRVSKSEKCNVELSRLSEANLHLAKQLQIPF